ncbi:hypothetical protein L1987_43890 [Smallanthus sonchifolius]|uniref:Uncharacterized protein n=1 Tax=Smallanthus sonchifolius TaxID=185202 RepID=A0ACB9GMS4_9ASTR|nr:hypothetical protein L1987_43890 [Smallanthus sonchifolius]
MKKTLDDRGFMRYLKQGVFTLGLDVGLEIGPTRSNEDVVFKGAFHRRQYITAPAALIRLGLPTEKPGPFTLIDPHFFPNVARSWRNTETCCEILGPGMILLKNYITPQGQLGVDIGGFYEPRNPSGDKLRLHMTCFGRNWDPVTKYENPYRSDGSDPPKVPREFIHFAKTVIKDAQAHLDDVPSMVPDVCVVNHYSSHGRLGLHQDRDESSDSLRKGLPVISISIGDTAEFCYGHTRDENKLESVFLRSGDVLIFGGKSRLIFHGVKKIYIMSVPEQINYATKLIPGRLNLTLRQF